MRVEAEIRRRIGQQGAITFAEFMELALFWSGGGYYLAGDPIGAFGDYYTSPRVHPVFGTLLAVHLVQMWQLLGRPDPFTLVELGAGNGLLCRDILACSDDLPPGFAGSLRYICLDLRPAWGVERGISGDRLAGGTCRLASAGLPFQGLVGCFLSNEFLDAFPVHQVTMEKDGLREVYVTLKDETLETRLDGLSTPALAARLEALEIELVEGQTAEISLGLDGWAEEVAASLKAGFALTIDYGHAAAELYSPERRYRGTLTTFYRHAQTDDPLRHIGHQDITAQVDFTTVVNAGRRGGLEPLGFVSQCQFLNNLGLDRMQQRLASLGLPQQDSRANRAGMLDLARSGGLGDFKVLAQGKGVSAPELWGVKRSVDAVGVVDGLPVPLLTPQHISLPEGRFPASELRFEGYRPLDDEEAG